MKTSRKILALPFALLALGLFGTLSARAAQPTVSLTVESFYLGSTVTFSPAVADADADMDYVTFAVSGPDGSSWSILSPDVNVPGAGTAAQQSGVSVSKSWTPSLPGLWTMRVTVHSLNGSASIERTFDVLAGTRTLNPLTVSSGENQIYAFAGELATATNTTTATTKVESGGSLMLCSGGRVVLKPGFHAQEGSSFWAAVDHNMNGYSDLEEATDTDGDGMFDAWEVDHGLNMLVHDANSDLDGDGTSNLQEFLTNRKPNDRADGAGLPSAVQLVVKSASGQYLGINTTTWNITPVANP